MPVKHREDCHHRDDGAADEKGVVQLHSGPSGFQSANPGIRILRPEVAQVSPPNGGWGSSEWLHGRSVALACRRGDAPAALYAVTSRRNDFTVESRRCASSAMSVALVTTFIEAPRASSIVVLSRSTLDDTLMVPFAAAVMLSAISRVTASCRSIARAIVRV